MRLSLSLEYQSTYNEKAFTYIFGYSASQLVRITYAHITIFFFDEPKILHNSHGL